MESERLIMFYDKGCESCEAMEPLIRKLEREYKIKVDRLGICCSEENKKLLGKYEGILATPFFYNEKTGHKISGETDYTSLKKWALEVND